MERGACADLAEALSLSGRRALVTGASLGIGRAIASWFAARGAVLALHHCSALDAQAGHPEAASELLAQMPHADHVAIDADLSLPDAGSSIASRATELLGGVDILVLCAAAQIREPLAQVDAQTVQSLAQTNFASSIAMLQTLTPPMCERRWGRVISIGSVNHVRPDPQLTVYAALKAAQHNLIVSGAKQYAAHGITMNSISPGLVATPRNAWRRADAAQWQALEQRANPMGRAGMPDEVAGVALLLASDAGAFITGADIPVDGGARL